MKRGKRDIKSNRRAKEWIKQAEYDYSVAETLFENRHYIYTIFMCHLCVEKGLKGLYCERLREVPPKTHDLIYLLKKMGLKPPEETIIFVGELSEKSIITRYPEDFSRIKNSFSEERAKNILLKTGGALEWIKNMLSKR